MKTFARSVLTLTVAFIAFMLISCGKEQESLDDYTTDVADYNKENYIVPASYFLDEIPEYASVTSFSFFREEQTLNRDYYLELSFDTVEDMERYYGKLMERCEWAVKNKTLPEGFDEWFIMRENPYDSSYTDMFSLNSLDIKTYNRDYLGYRYERIGTTDAFSANYAVISYSYEDLTVIQNFCCYQSFREIDEYNPLYLKRFGADAFSDKPYGILYDAAGNYESFGFKVVDMTPKMTEFMESSAADVEAYKNKYGLIPAMFYFYNNVNDRGIWDIKLKEEWQFDENTVYTFRGRRMRYDDHGNICFAYIGGVVFSKEALCMGAGINQTTKFDYTFGDMKTWYDDPRDTVMIRYGHDLYTGLCP